MQRGARVCLLARARAGMLAGMSQQVRVAIVQAASVPLDHTASTRKAIEQIDAAADAGARLVVLGETWLSGYPAWIDSCPDAALWDNPAVKRHYARMREASVTVPGPEVEAIAEAARRTRSVVGIGVQERVDRGPGNGTLYNAFLLFDADGTLVVHHRKLVPTYTERLVWGPGDGAGLGSVNTAVGRVGGLICWEHWMPLARQALHEDGEDIHVALWPGVHEVHLMASRHYAFEGRCFVLAAGLLMPESDLPPELGEPRRGPHSDGGLAIRGGSAIIGPDGQVLAGPVFDREELVIADLDLARRDGERMTLDVAGHYHRPDVFALERRQARSRVRER